MKKIVIATASVASITLIAALGVYAFYNFGGTPTGSDFANFGSYLGGVGATVLGLATSILVLIQLVEINKQLKHQKKTHSFQNEIASLNFSLQRIDVLLKKELYISYENETQITLVAEEVLFFSKVLPKFKDALEDPDTSTLIKARFEVIGAEVIFYCINGLNSCCEIAKEGNYILGLAYSTSIKATWLGISDRFKDWEIDFDTEDELREHLSQRIKSYDK